MGDFSIQISSNLVNRLTDDDDKSKKTKRTRIKATRELQQHQTKINQKQVSGVSETHKRTEAPGWPIQSPYFIPVIPPLQSANAELDAIRSVLEESESVMEKLQKQEETMVQEVRQRAKDLHEKEFKLCNEKPMPCLVESAACWACYKDHVNDPLKCAHFVKKFADCARIVRQQLSSAV